MTTPVRLALLAIALVTLSVVTPGQQEPVDTGYRETVEVDLAQIEVSVWPKSGQDAEICQGLTGDDFELIVNGRSREITAVDWLGSPEIMQRIDGVAVADPTRPPLTIVLFFDLWHLNVFFRGFDCPMTKPLAFDEARKLVREEFREGDRLLLVTFAGWPQIHGDWIREPSAALRALDRLEVSPFVQNVHTEHLHHQSWIDGVKSLVLALGRYPGRKEMFYLGDDFRFDDVMLQVYDLAARAQVNQVSIHAIDLLWSCRNLPGAGCANLERGGLLCTPFKDPLALGYMSVNTGGRFYEGSASLAQAVQQVRSMRGCKYLISFPVSTKEGKRSPQATIRLTRKGLQLHFPSSFGNPRREPKQREEQNALFLLPRFGQGIQAEVGLWPLRPSGKKKRWKGIMVARLERAPGDPWSAEVQAIQIEAVAYQGSKIYGKFRKRIAGEELVRFRDGESKLLVFPVEKIRPGRNTISLRATSEGGEISANVRSWLDVPTPPGPGQTGPWMLVDGLARVGGRITVMPALDGLFPEDHGSFVLAYGCRGEDSDFRDGRLIALDGEAVVPVPIGWFDEPDEFAEAGETCGWLAGQIEPSLGPGLWRFEPPASLDADPDRACTVEFRVTPGPADGAYLRARPTSSALHIGL